MSGLRLPPPCESLTCSNGGCPPSHSATQPARSAAARVLSHLLAVRAPECSAIHCAWAATCESCAIARDCTLGSRSIMAGNFTRCSWSSVGSRAMVRSRYAIFLGSAPTLTLFPSPCLLVTLLPLPLRLNASASLYSAASFFFPLLLLTTRCVLLLVLALVLRALDGFSLK